MRNEKLKDGGRGTEDAERRVQNEDKGRKTFLEKSSALKKL